MLDIPCGSCFTSAEAIDKGYSDDKKYRVTGADGARMFLRVSDISQHDRKKAEYEMLERAYASGIPVPQPLGFGLCDSGKSCYSLLGWIDGEDMAKALPLMSDTRQYILGLKTGELLRRLHDIPAPQNAGSWASRFSEKINAWVDKYSANRQIHCDTGELIIRYLANHRHVPASRPQTFVHGDYNAENIILAPDGNVYAIDFNGYNSGMGDPWGDLSNMAWMPVMHPFFYTGQINGYFGGTPPAEFWDVFTYYLAYNALAALTDPYELNGIEDGTYIVNNILKWTDSFKSSIPTWYMGDVYLQYIDSVPYRLKSAFDFSFIGSYGAVFKVFDSQDSGNICFGTQKDGHKYFVKFAGAPTALSCVSASEAIANLKACAEIYKDLAHPSLIRLVGEESVGGGFALIFDWVEGECPHPMYPASRKRFLTLPPKELVQIFEDILEFHIHVAAKNYAAIDFYDGSILYDIENKRTVVCDIDFYAKRPYINRMGRMWGSSRFMSPEELALGAEIDEITNVYTMGATAFALLSGSSRSQESWPLGKGRYNVVLKAVNDDRALRQQSIARLYEEWKAAGDN